MQREGQEAENFAQRRDASQLISFSLVALAFFSAALRSFVRCRSETRGKPRVLRPFELVDFSRGPRVDDGVVEIAPLPSHLGSIALCGFECPLLLLLLRRVMRDTRCRVHARAILELYPTQRIFILFPVNLQRAACTGSSAS